MTPSPPQSVIELKRYLAETLVRSKLDYTDDILILNAFFCDFRWTEGYTPVELESSWRSALRRPKPPDHSYSLYIHVPYCAKKCRFCYCATEISTNRSVIDGYVPQLRREMEFFSSAFKGVEFPLFQIGGGTPSLLSEAQLEELLTAAEGSFRIARGGFGVAEFNPASTTREKLAVLRRHGFDRISFGVQSLDQGVLKREGREYQTFKMTQEALKWAAELGFPVVNVDLVLGLDGDTVEGFLAGFEKIARLGPTTIMVPGLTLSDAYMKTNGLSREENLRRYEAMVPRALEGMRLLCERYGYGTDNLIPEHAIWVLYRKGIPKAVTDKISRHDHFEGGAGSILGLGHHARSWLFGEAAAIRYPESFEKDKALYRVAPLKPKYEMMRYVLYAIETSAHVDFQRFQERFGQDAREVFSRELKALALLDKVRLTPSGFFFLPLRDPERVFYGLFFLAELLSQSPFSNGKLGEAFVRRLKRELAPITLEELTAA